MKYKKLTGLNDMVIRKLGFEAKTEFLYFKVSKPVEPNKLWKGNIFKLFSFYRDLNYCKFLALFLQLGGSGFSSSLWNVKFLENNLDFSHLKVGTFYRLEVFSEIIKQNFKCDDLKWLDS